MATAFRHAPLAIVKLKHNNLRVRNYEYTQGRFLKIGVGKTDFSGGCQCLNRRWKCQKLIFRKLDYFVYKNVIPNTGFGFAYQH